MWSGHTPVNERAQLNKSVSFPEHSTPYSTADSVSPPKTPLDTGIAPEITEQSEVYITTQTQRDVFPTLKVIELTVT